MAQHGVLSSSRLAGKTALITGAAGGIGSGIAHRFAAEGAKVALVDRHDPIPVQESIRSSGGQAESFHADLSVAEECESVVTEVSSWGGGLDVLVNNAGVMRRGDILGLSVSDWELTMNVNLTAMFCLCRSAVPIMVDRGGGVVVNIASQWGLIPSAGHIAYNTSKAGVITFTKSLARDFGSKGVRANAICPGEILTPMVQKKLDDEGLSEQDLARNIPVGRLGRPEDVAALAAFLSSSDASFISGSTIEITGAQVNV